MFIEIVTEDEQSTMVVGESRIFYRRFSKDKYEEITKIYTEQTGTDRQGKPTYFTDDQAVNDDLLDYIIVDWENVKHPKTKEDVECSKKNKMALPGNVKLQLIDKANASSTDIKQAEKKILPITSE